MHPDRRMIARLRAGSVSQADIERAAETIEAQWRLCQRYESVLWHIARRCGGDPVELAELAIDETFKKYNQWEKV